MLRFKPGLTIALVAAALLASCGGGRGDTTGTSTVASTTASTTTEAIIGTDGAGMEIPAAFTRRERLGQLIFTDRNLSEPPGTPCMACHVNTLGFAGNHGSGIGVAQGSKPTSIGIRNAMTNAYNGFIPAFGFQLAEGAAEAIGGHFWDGRADTMAQQALGPFLNPLEMNNASAKAVMDKIAASSYANLFRQEFGANVFANPDTAFAQVGVVIEALERSNTFQSFSSKYDAVLRKQASFTAAEQRGMALFQDPARANCAGCHVMNPASANPQDSLFSEFTYYATGIPRNRAIPANADANFFDLGLCGPNRSKPVIPATMPAGTTAEQFCGMFRMPTLRNVAERPAYMHNGFFKDLKEVVRFYATRASNPERWYGASGQPNDLPAAYQANLEVTKPPFNRARGSAPLLSDAEINDIVAFLRTLSDGFNPAAAPPTPATGP